MNRRAPPMRMSSSPGIVAAHRRRGAYARRQLQPNPTKAAVPGNYWAHGFPKEADMAGFSISPNH